MKGSSVYITAQELEALHDVTSYLSAIIEAADNAAHLIAAKTGLHSVIDKAEKSKRAAARRSMIKTALRVAENG